MRCIEMENYRGRIYQGIKMGISSRSMKDMFLLSISNKIPDRIEKALNQEIMRNWF